MPRLCFLVAKRSRDDERVQRCCCYCTCTSFLFLQHYSIAPTLSRYTAQYTAGRVPCTKINISGHRPASTFLASHPPVAVFVSTLLLHLVRPSPILPILHVPRPCSTHPPATRPFHKLIPTRGLASFVWYLWDSTSDRSASSRHGLIATGEHRLQPSPPAICIYLC